MINHRSLNLNLLLDGPIPMIFFKSKSGTCHVFQFKLNQDLTSTNKNQLTHAKTVS